MMMWIRYLQYLEGRILEVCLYDSTLNFVLYSNRSG